MKVSDYLASFLAKNGIRHVFQIIGGASVHMVQSLGTTKGIDYRCVQHEQAGAMAAEAYARITKNIGAAMATSGPGMTNLITGIACAYFDSIPMICITGQVNTSESRQSRKVRQIGFQETDIVEMVKPITKFAVQVTNPEDIRYYLEKVIYIAKSGRPGPVLLDMPMNVQRAEIIVSKLRKFNPSEIILDIDNTRLINQNISKAIQLLKSVQRAVVIAGGAIRYADQIKEFEILVNLLGIPVVSTWSGIDVLHHNHPFYIGQIGVYGSRAANFTVQNSDCILSLGSRLDTRITGGKPATFARAAQKIVVDIDRAEIFKGRGLTPDIAICADIRDVIPKFISETKNAKIPKNDSWLKQTIAWKEKYPAVLSEWYKKRDYVDPYVFIETLSKHLKNDAVVIADCGGNLTWTIQAFHVRKGQRLFSAMGNSPMAYSFPASIGASIALGGKEIICIIGDGGFQMNIQELQTLKYYNLPIKIFILNSKSYAIIKQFQEEYFNSNFLATEPQTGYSVPDFIKIVKAYGLKSSQIKTNKQIESKIKQALEFKGPFICDVLIPSNAKLLPKVSFGNPIEDLSPLLPREEFYKNMIIAPLKQP
ncbi:MAG: hypothetical protein ACD_32C00113G0025 [uncultured bacterium]|uniref:Acetolactate synthase n=1 Tax=Candidatus Daviesbacteria bacterium GW2011_GWC2_40_12 TaxID=1618431 RepID=A0A0G0QRA7_9BACT|nr:MAG: hypothetical protein ACD_32C00113G0025 [uncultured bacterium]KKR17264.1 MAG: Acetolactate synthase [Candidatus Daviesbacteria bacterium GW2011_GWA2_39_33]KKR42663.1 MAG: Acetolactate synthase [Candidatus Daviesbacteria bacterium GW2011_GWC2_40_12]OGE21338.1 MAG: hypothetical protein A2778_04180 [Candidatus Daviesbacteria bacterium RIFCSPHIGHO2_01_FULL_40_24]OGE30144.1 MAG: hypothetical protein A3C29_01940 [Candidatus Daviesbacteria bacterium RIFCSPHIGHO2_02_FULL_40_16]OGE43421.1 MAG: h